MNIAKAPHSLGPRFKKWREARKLSQNAAAKVIGWGTSQYVSNIENGTNMPPVRKLPAMAAAYGISLSTLRTLIVAEHTRIIDKNLKKVLISKKAQAKIQAKVKRLAATH